MSKKHMSTKHRRFPGIYRDFGTDETSMHLKNQRTLSPESLEALASVDTERMRKMVLTHIRSCGRRGATDDEVSEALGLVHNSVAPRRTELEKAGLVVKLFDEKGQRVRRETRQGSTAGVYVAIEFAPRRPVGAEPRSLFGDLKPVRYPD
jgi:hypothetical protein